MPEMTEKEKDDLRAYLNASPIFLRHNGPGAVERAIRMSEAAYRELDELPSVPYAYPHERNLPSGWRAAKSTPVVMEAGSQYQHTRTKQNVTMSCRWEKDGKKWLHVSTSFLDRLPTYDELAKVKAVFIGKGKTAYQIFPGEDRHVNLHPYCLHLWHCLDGDVTPDFRRGGGEGI